MEEVTIPSSAIPHIIGKDGVNIKDIQNRSGATCIVKKKKVIITGSDNERHIARNIIQDCIDNSISVYHHPNEAIIALRSPLIGLKSVLFTRYEGVVDIGNINKAYFVLDEGDKRDKDYNDDDISLEGLNISKTKSIIAPEEDRALVMLIVERLTDEVTKSRAESFNFKARANIGKQLFYPANKGVSQLPPSILFNELLEYKVGYQRDVKTTFMNYILESLAKAVELRLMELGYKECNDESEAPSASIHLLDVKKKKRFTISTEIEPNNSLKIRKCRPTNIKHLFVSFTRSKSIPDFRIKFLSQKSCNEVIPPNISHLINSAVYNPVTKTVKSPKDANYHITTVRVKIKRKFFKNGDSDRPEMKLIISDLYEKGKKYMQIIANNVDLHETLNNRNQIDTDRNKWEEKCMNEMVKFVEEMNKIVRDICI